MPHLHPRFAKQGKNVAPYDSARTDWMRLRHGQKLHSRKSHKNVAWMFCARVGKTLSHLQILGCGLYQNAFGGRA